MHSIHDQPIRPQLSAEVVEFFHCEASALTERIQDRIHELDQGNPDREASLRTNIAATILALRHVAATFGVADATERAISGNAEARETVQELFDLIRVGLV